MKQCCSPSRHGSQPGLLARFVAAACAFALAVGLVPLASARAEKVPAADDTASIEALLSASPYVEGEALVVYRADETQPSLRSLDAADAADPLADAGFAVEDAWDFSGVDAVTDEPDVANLQGISAFALGEESEEQGGALDATVMRVTKPGVDTATLLEELRTVEGVLAVAPNYVHELETSPVMDETAATLAATTEKTDAAAAPSSNTVAESPTVDGTDVLPVGGTPAATNDPLTALQWSLDNAIASPEGVDANSDINFAAAYEQARNGVETIVAILDDGVDYRHEDLKDAIWENPGTIAGIPGGAGTHGYDFVAGDDDPSPEAGDSHGTHCAGIVAATSDNGLGISGVSPNTKIMALRIGGTDTGGSMNDGAVLASYEFLLRAKLAGENVAAASNSWGGIVSPVTEYAINQAGRAGVLTVFAAGNDDADTSSIVDDSVSYGLSKSPYVLTAAATSPQGTYASYTNHGGNVVDVAAPGSIMLSSIAEDAFQPAAAKTLDEEAKATGTQTDQHSLYYHNMADLAESGASITLHGADGEKLDQDRLTTSTGVGLDGRTALEASVSNADASEFTEVLWSIQNPFKGMAWEEASQACISVLPGVAVATGASANAATSVYAWPLLRDGNNNYLLDDAYSGANTDNLSCQPAKFASEEAFDSIRDAETLRVGVQVQMGFDDTNAGGGTASFTLTDFGIGFSDGLRYQYFSGTSMACPLVAGTVGLVSSAHPGESALEVRGRIVGGTRALHDAASGDYPACVENWDSSGNPKQTASDGTLDLTVALGDEAHPNTWGASASDDGTAVELEGYRLGQVTELVIDDVAVDRSLWQTSADGSRLVIQLSDLLDGERHAVKVSNGAAAHRGVYAFPLVDQALEFQKVIDMPDIALSDKAGFGSGILVAAADRLFCLDSKGRYLYSYDPEGPDGWTACQAPVDAGFTVQDFRVDTAVAYADGKLYATVQYDRETEDPSGSAVLYAAVTSYDIAADSWDAGRLDFVHASTEGSGHHYPAVALAACEGSVYLTFGGGDTRALVRYDPRTGNREPVVIDDESDPDGLFRSLESARTVPLAAVGDELRFLGYVSAETDEASGQEQYALALGTYDGQAFDVLDVPTNAPRFEKNELDALLAYANQAAAATGDSLVLTGASAEGLGDTYQVNCETGKWTSLGVRAPGNGKAEVSTACFYRGTYYVLAASTDAQGEPATALYRLPDEVSRTANDHTASAQANEGGTVAVTYGGGARAAKQAADDVRAQAATRAADDASMASSSQVERVALGDTVTWTATPLIGYEFAGWYDNDGTLVDNATSYAQPVVTDVALIARFVPTAGPGPNPDPDPTPTTLPGANASAKQLASTGDGIGMYAFSTALPLIAVSTCALALAALRLLRRARAVKREG